MRPNFNPDTTYIATEDGVYLRGNRSLLHLKGKSLYNLLTRLAPLLDGQHTLEELTADLDGARKKMVTDFVTKLLHYHLIQDISEEPQDTLDATITPTIRERYAPAMSFISSLQQTAASTRFATFRNQRFLLIGSGLTLTALIQATLGSGVQQVTAVSTSAEDMTIEDRSSRDEGTFPTSDDEQVFQWLACPQWNDEADVLNTLLPYDCVVYVADRPMLAQAQLLHRLCFLQRKTFMQAIVVEDDAWIGPLVSSEKNNCWECAWRRLQDNLPQQPWYDFRDQPQSPVSRFLTQSVATLLTNRLLFEVFRHVTQTNMSETKHELTTLHLPTLQMEQHAFMAHPHCQVSEHPEPQSEQQFLDRIRLLQIADPWEPTTFLELLGKRVDSRLGLFTTINGNNFVQSPLAIYQAKLASPLHREHRTQLPTVIGTASNMPHGLLRTGQLACERYAAEIVEPRRLLSNQTVQQLPVSSIPFITATSFEGLNIPEQEIETWCWALNLQTQQAHLIPAWVAYPALQRSTSPKDYTYTRGVGSGMSWAEAVSMALLDWCNYLTLGQIKEGQQVYAQVDLTRCSLTPAGTHFYHLLQISGTQLAAYDVTGPLQVPTFAICIEEQVITYSTHCDASEALSAGLEQALQHYQSQYTHQTAYALPAVPELPHAQRSNHSPIVPAEQLSAKSWWERQIWLQQRLQDQQRCPFVLPLDHDPALQEVLPYIVRVLLTRA